VNKFSILLVSGLAIASVGTTQDPAWEGILDTRTRPPRPIGRNVREQPGDYFPLATVKQPYKQEVASQPPRVRDIL
jgi:hypothetical protein